MQSLSRVACIALFSALPLAAADVPTAVAFVDWSVNVATITNQSFGMNLFQGLEPTIAGGMGSAAYAAHVGVMMGGRGIVRIHNEGMMTNLNGGGWLCECGAGGVVDWNYTKIAGAIQGAFYTSANSDTRVMLTLSGFPSAWTNASAPGTLNATYNPAWIGLARAIVSFITVNLSTPLDYVELTNEWDQPYAAADNTLGLASLVLSAASAVRSVSPHTRVGAPAWARPDLWQNVGPFINATLGSLDFYSYHSYSTGSTGTANSSIYQSASNAFIEGQIRDIIGWYSNDTDVPLMHDENNISWNPPDARMTNIVSAIYDSLFIAATVTAGAASTMRWNEADGWYGACNNDANWTPRPPAYVWQSFNELAWGSVAAAATAPSTSRVTAFASQGANGAGTVSYLLLLVNWSEAPVNVAVNLLWPGGATPAPTTPVQWRTITNDGMSTSSTTLGALANVSMPMDTVMFFCWPQM